MAQIYFFILLLASLGSAFNLTLDDGSTYIGDQYGDTSLPHGFGKLIKANGDVYE